MNKKTLNSYKLKFGIATCIHNLNHEEFKNHFKPYERNSRFFLDTFIVVFYKHYFNQEINYHE